MVSEVRVRRLGLYLKSEKLEIQEHNVRPWGSYEPIFKFPNTDWFSPGEVVGWGWHPIQVIYGVFDKYRHNPLFQGWVGYNRLIVINEIYNLPDPEMNAAPVLTQDDSLEK